MIRHQHISTHIHTVYNNNNVKEVISAPKTMNNKETPLHLNTVLLGVILEFPKENIEVIYLY